MARDKIPLFKLSVKAWKWMISIIVLAFLVGIISELVSAWNAWQPGKHGSLGVTLEDQAALGSGQNTNLLRIVSLTNNSPLRAVNAQEGDILSFVRPVDRWRKFTSGEFVSLTLEQAGTKRELTVQAVTSPIPPFEKIEYSCRMVLALLALASALFVGLMGARDPANRRLAMTFVALGLSAYFNFNFSSGSLIFLVSKLAYLAISPLVWFGAASFGLAYRNQAIYTTDPEFKPTMRHDPITVLFSMYTVLAGFVFLYNIRFGFGFETPGLWQLNMASIFLGFFILYSSLYDGWRRTKGEIRERHLWILGSSSVYAVPAVFSWFPQFESAIIVSYVGQLLMYVGMIYSVMQYKVLNFGFAMSRTLILSIVSLLIYGFLEIIKYLVEHYLSGHGVIDRRQLLAAVILVILLHMTHKRVRDFLERWLLRRWYKREQRLRQFAKDAASFTSIDALLAALISALDKFTNGDKSAIYLLEPDGGFKLSAGSAHFGPVTLLANDGLVVTLQSKKSALDSSAVEEASLQSSLNFDLAVPMMHRGQLSGFVLVGADHKSSYRPDQVSVLQIVIKKISLSLFSLKITILEEELKRLQNQVEKDALALQIMSGRRKGVRILPS